MPASELKRHYFIINTLGGEFIASYFSDASVPRIGEKLDLVHLNISDIFAIVDVIHKPNSMDEQPYAEARTAHVTYVKLIVVKE